MVGETFFYLPYAATTYGDRETNLTVGIGWLGFESEWSNYPTFMVSGTHRISNGLAILSENYRIPLEEGESFYLGIHGVRFLSEKNAFDIGLIVIPEATGSIPLPYVGYARAF